MAVASGAGSARWPVKVKGLGMSPKPIPQSKVQRRPPTHGKRREAVFERDNSSVGSALCQWTPVLEQRRTYIRHWITLFALSIHSCAMKIQGG